MLLCRIKLVFFVSIFIRSSLSFDLIGALWAGSKVLNDVAGTDIIKTVWQLLYGIDVCADPENPEALSYTSSLTVPTVAIVERYVHFAAASYCEAPLLSNLTCKECQKMDPSVQMIKVIKNEEEDTQGFISVDSGRQEIIVTFRGTYSLSNVALDFSYEWIESPYADGTRIHKGFYVATMSLYPEVLELLSAVSAQLPNYNVVLTGHSLGGSMSTITFYLLSHDLPNLNYVLITFGEPRPGDRAFADYINQQNISTARVVNELDMVPHGIAVSVGFVHHLAEFWTRHGVTRICNLRDYEDVTCSASQPSQSFNGIDHFNYLGTAIERNCH